MYFNVSKSLQILFIIDCISISVLRHRRVCFCLCDSELQFAATVSNLQYVVLCIIRLWTANFWSPKWTLVHCILFCIFIILYNIVISQMINSCKLSIKFWKLEYNCCPDCRSFWTKRVCPQNVFTVPVRTQTQHSLGVTHTTLQDRYAQWMISEDNWN